MERLSVDETASGPPNVRLLVRGDDVDRCSYDSRWVPRSSSSGVYSMHEFRSILSTASLAQHFVTLPPSAAAAQATVQTASIGKCIRTMSLRPCQSDQTMVHDRLLSVSSLAVTRRFLVHEQLFRHDFWKKKKTPSQFRKQVRIQ